MTAPELELYSHSDRLSSDDVSALTETLHRALPIILKSPGDIENALVLGSLPLVEISFVDDPTIAQVHADFMDDPTATDVITFQHGEILVSVDTAERVAATPEVAHSTLREVALYAIHGLLHLHGYDDLSEPARTIMHARQAAILDTVDPRQSCPVA